MPPPSSASPLRTVKPLIIEPSLLLADEPTGNLDSATSREIMEILVSLHDRGETILLVTHERDIAAYSDRLITLRDGVIETDQRHTIGEPVA